MIPIRIRTSRCRCRCRNVQVQGLGMVQYLLITQLGPYHVITYHPLYTYPRSDLCKQVQTAKKKQTAQQNIGKQRGRGEGALKSTLDPAIPAPLYILVHAHELEGTVTLTAVESCIMKSILSPRAVKVCLSTNRVSATKQYVMQSCSEAVFNLKVVG